jgi:hypothetical protein
VREDFLDEDDSTSIPVPVAVLGDSLEDDSALLLATGAVREDFLDEDDSTSIPVPVAVLGDSLEDDSALFLATGAVQEDFPDDSGSILVPAVVFGDFLEEDSALLLVGGAVRGDLKVNFEPAELDTFRVSWRLLVVLLDRSGRMSVVIPLLLIWGAGLRDVDGGLDLRGRRPFVDLMKPWNKARLHGCWNLPVAN